MKLKCQEEKDLMLNPRSQVLLKGDLLSYLPGSIGQGGQPRFMGNTLHTQDLCCFLYSLQSKSHLAFHL